MPNIKPISDLRNYNEVLRDVTIGSPVFLTKNGRGKYAIVDILDYEKAKATIQLVNELAKGKQSGEEKGWLSADEVKAHLKEMHKNIALEDVKRLCFHNPLGRLFSSIIIYRYYSKLSLKNLFCYPAYSFSALMAALISFAP